jgi:16S rRNA (adenine1518-N6/adenine1519-N6)-dimethyltransferase
MVSGKKTTRRSLQEHGLAPKKRFGQNFLIHPHTAEAIVVAADLQPRDRIIEVGVGLGALTRPLAKAVSHVFGYEIDHGIIRYHQEQDDLPANVTLIHQDILQADFGEMVKQCGDRLKIVANLPYSITNPFLFKLFDNSTMLHSVTVMVQKEVAERLMAKPNTKAYGVPTILLSSCASVQSLLTLKPGEFHPRPKIDSTVIRLDFQNKPNDLVEPFDAALLQKVVRTAFNQRRKTLQNSLNAPHLFPAEGPDLKKKSLLENAIVRAGISPLARPESLTLRNFLDLTQEISRYLHEQSHS